MLELNRFAITRIVAIPAALDMLAVAADSIVLRTAPDEVMVLPAADIAVDDAHAIVVAENSWSGVWLETAELAHILLHHCEWQLPAVRPAFAQGAIADIPAKLWLETDRALLLIPSPYVTEFNTNLSHGSGL